MPTMTRFGTENSQDEQGSHGVTWVDIDISDVRERDWLEAWKEIGDQARSLLLEPVRFTHRENMIDGMSLSLRTMMAGETDDFDHLADLKLLIGKSRAITVRDGELAAVDELRLFLRSGRSLATPVDLLGFMVSGMTQRMEAIIYDLVMDTDDIEDRLLDSGSVPSAQTMHQLRRRIFRIRRQLSSVRQVISPIATDPALPLDADDRETLVRCSNHVTRYMESLEDCRARAQMLQDPIGAIDAESGHQHAAGGRQTSSRFGLSGLLGILFRLCHNRR